ncbi:hypothetical protein UPYG_G00289930 [Umbra pygmaea]|uniref:Laminin subunit gamma-2-like n=1 Tax=Umbra pygmaea TaxID=75934 RepID=A0ABD0W4K2_UMBPY
MKSSWIFLCGLTLCTWVTVQGTYSYGGSDICKCNGRSRYCLPDSGGLHCVDCQGNTEGRHCERCKEGFYHQRAGDSCLPCLCSTIGSVGSRCDKEGRCSCKAGVQGLKCDQCPDGTSVTSDGCFAHGGQLADSPVRTLPCFCYGHSSECSLAIGYSAYTITSNFNNGLEGWRAVPAHGGSLSQVQFRWSSTHRDLEVISKDILPVYLYAPGSYLGNQELSYGQNLSFSLRLDRGIRYPSTADVVLEGSGLRVTASLGDLRTSVPCGQKITYKFRLDEQPSSKWRPHLSAFQFQTLLQNLTAIKIRGTFGENGRGYLDNVVLESAHQGPGTPATWVQLCACPEGFQGQFCEKCAVGFTRSTPGKGSYSSCKPCNCQGGTCDTETGDCFSADETPGQDHTCLPGDYRDPLHPGNCLKCPCLSGASCSVDPITQEVQCNLCPPGTTGSRCHICQEGFFGDPLGEYSSQAVPCQPCNCNGHTDPSAVRSCDPETGMCLKCLNNTTGYSCETCLNGYHHNVPSEACIPCGCDPQGSLLNTCSDQGQCICKDDFEGLKCKHSKCPSCFNTVKYQLEGYTNKMEDVRNLFRRMESGRLPENDNELEKVIRDAEDRVSDLQRKTQELSEYEKTLQARVSEISTDQLTEDRAITAITQTIEDVKLQGLKYERQISDINTLISDVWLKLKEAKRQIDKAELPSADAAVGTDILSTFVTRANDLAEKHQSIAGIVDKTANSALAESEMSLMNMRSIMMKENRTKQLIGDLKTKYDANVAQVQAMDGTAASLSRAAERESREAADTLRRIISLEQNIPGPITDTASVLARLDGMKEQVTNNLKEYHVLQENTQEDTAAVKDLLIRGEDSQKKYEGLLDKANAAKVDTEKALNSITDNIDGVDDVLKTLKDFERQFSTNRNLADDAIKKFSGIENTIQQAVGSNKDTQFIIDSVSEDYEEAERTIPKLDAVVQGLEKMSGNLQVASDIGKNAFKLNNDIEDLKSQAITIDGLVLTERDNAERKKGEAAKASMEAIDAFKYAKDTRQGVADTLLAINDLLNMFGHTGHVDEKKLEELEQSVAGARAKVKQTLKPKVQELDEMEASQRAKLSGIIVDIDMIMADIKNLEVIKQSIPNVCYNAQPIEQA